MESIREELRTFENDLKNDLDEFNSKLNLTRKHLFDYINQQIEYLKNIKNDYNDDFNYLDQENTKTCSVNQQEFDKLCLEINKNDHDQIFVSKLFKQFKQSFPLRPKMLKSIPEFNFKDIQIQDLIIKQNSPILDNNSSSPFINQDNHSFVPIDSTQISSLPTNSIGSSYHKQLASQNNENENEIEPESRLVSTCSTINEIDNMIPILFKIPYQHNRSPHLMCFNEEENYLLIYPFSSHQFEYLSLNPRQISSIDHPFKESILNLGYSTRYNLFYITTRQTNRFVLFRLNQQKQIEIDQEIELINSKEHFINVHIYENLIFYLYLSSSSIVMFGKYDLENSSFLPSISYKNNLYDSEENSSYKIIDFTVNNLYICFLIQLKTKSKIIIYDYENMDKINSFDLIDSIKPLSIISTELNRKSESTTTTTTQMSNNDIKLLLFVNDVKSHLIHCCNYQEYLIPIQINAFGICTLNDGNLSLVASKDIRALNVQDSLKTND